MTTTTCLEEKAHEFLKEELAASPGTAEARALRVQESGLFWMLPELVEVMEQTRDQPVAQMAPMIRRRIIEQRFINDNGDSTQNPFLQAEIDFRVSQMLRVLTRVRELAEAQGLWSDAPVTPIMFG